MPCRPRQWLPLLLVNRGRGDQPLCICQLEIIASSKLLKSFCNLLKRELAERYRLNGKFPQRSNQSKGLTAGMQNLRYIYFWYSQSDIIYFLHSKYKNIKKINIYLAYPASRELSLYSCWLKLIDIKLCKNF